MFALEKYKGINSRFTCPSCGEKRCFVRYIDEVGEYLDDTVGRCNRESKCSYHYTPKQYFTDYPERVEKDELRVKRGRSLRPQKQTLDRSEPISFHSRSEFDPTLGNHFTNPFAQFLFDLFPGDQDYILEVLNRYYVGTYPFEGGQQKIGSAALTCFWQIDILGRIRKGKLMRYDALTGKRRPVFNFQKAGEEVEIPVYWVHRVLQKKGQLPEIVNFQNCFFGEHLLRSNRSLPIGVVEAEKTAIICSLCRPETTWIAVGSKQHLGGEKLHVLRNRKVIFYPDADAYDSWCEKAIEMQRLGIDAYVDSEIENTATIAQKTAGYDLADLLIDQQREINKYNILVSEYNAAVDCGLTPALPPKFEYGKVKAETASLIL